MSDFLQTMAADAAVRFRAGECAAEAGWAFALEKRRVDAESALEGAHARMKTELINSLRTLTSQIKP